MPRRIEGIIASAGAGSRGGEAWDLIVFLCPWREVGGDVRKEKLRLLVPMDNQAVASRAMDKWNKRKGRGVALALESLEPPSKRQPWGLAYGRGPLEAIEADAALQAVADEHAKPRHVRDPVLGELVLDRGVSWYGGTRTAGDLTYEVAVETREPDDQARVAKAVARGSSVVQRLEGKLPSILEAIVDEELDLYNSKWRQKRNVLSRAAFRDQLALSSVVIGDGRTTAYFDCNDLFFDHIIEVRMSPRGRITEICIAG